MCKVFALLARLDPPVGSCDSSFASTVSSRHLPPKEEGLSQTFATAAFRGRSVTSLSVCV